MSYPAYSNIIAVVGISCVFFFGLYLLVLLSRRWKRFLQSRIKTALLRRRNHSDKFRDINGYSWDSVMVFKVYDEEEVPSLEQIKYTMKYILDQLTLGGLETRLFYSLQKKEVYCKIRAPIQRLMKEADRTNTSLPLDPLETRKACETGRENLWLPLKIPERSEQTSLPPYEFIYAKFQFDTEINDIRADLANIYKKWPIQVYRGTQATYSEEFATNSPMTNQESSGFIPDVHDTVGSTGVELSVLNNLLPKKKDIEEPDIMYSVFRGVDRLKLISSIIKAKSPGCCFLDIVKLEQEKCILGYLPLHDCVELSVLEDKWLRVFQFPWQQNVDAVKNYFGEKIGLYFAWVGFYTTALIPAAFLGVLAWIWVAVEDNNPNAPSIPYFCGFMALWSSLLLEYWKRAEKTYSLRWGMIGYEESEQIRPQYKGTQTKSPIDGKPALHFSKYERTKRAMLSGVTIMGFTIVVIGVIAAIFAIRVALTVANIMIGKQQVGNVVSSILIALQVQIMNKAFSDLAIRLNDHENHRTDTEYEDALIMKTFLFQFVNSYASLFYIAFVKPYFYTIDPCADQNCMLELQTTLGTIFLTRVTVGNITELAVPLFNRIMNIRERAIIANSQTPLPSKGRSSSIKRYSTLGVFVTDDYTDSLSSSSHVQQHKIDVSEIEKTFVMPEYNLLHGTLEDYSETVMDFGYTTMFVAAFPLATLMALLNNYIELRVDAWKLCQILRRPEPKGCEDIGTWSVILEVVSISAVFINSALVAFTSTHASNFSWVIRIWIFILMSTGLFCIRLLVAYSIPDVPLEVEIQLKRQEFITGKLLDNIEDEEDVDISHIGLIPNFDVHNTDLDPM